MTETQVNLSTRLKLLGFAKGIQMKLYGEVFELVSEPIVMSENVVLIDATEKKSGLPRRVRIPLPIVNMAKAAYADADAERSGGTQSGAERRGVCVDGEQQSALLAERVTA